MDIIIIIASVILGILSIGIFRNRRDVNTDKNTFSILIACRDESENLPFLFRSLEKLNYPADKYEIILADDASSDNSLQSIKEFCSKNKNANYVYLTQKDKEYKGKKAALKKAAEQARFDFLAFTDADCVIPENWLTNHNKHISEKVGIVAGYYVETICTSFAGFLQKISAATFSSTIGLGVPFSSAGSNLIVRRKAFEEVSGYEKIKNYLAGDDKLLLNLIRKTKWKIVYNPEEPVKTHPLKKTKVKLQQLKRRFGKFSMSPPSYKFYFLLVLFFYLYLPYNVFALKKIKNFLLYFGMMLVFWFSNLYLHKMKFKLIDIVYLLIYPYFMLIFTFLGQFTNWNWKNQTNRK